MAKQSNAKKPPKIFTKEEQIKQVLSNNVCFDTSITHLQPKPTRFFEVGEEVIIGNLKNVVIEEILFDGLAYIYSCLWAEKQGGEGITKYQVSWWFDINKIDSRPNNVPRLMNEGRTFSTTSSDLDGVLFFMNSNGLVVDPTYQREYVWTEENKDALIESIFDRLDIGSFLFVRHHGYLHQDDTTEMKYRTLDGREVSVMAKDDYTVVIIDGQQRLTTICDFVLGRRPYKGIYFSQLHWRDQIEFLGSTVSYRIVNEELTNEKEILRMFLQANRGVPQTPEHLAKVQAIYDAM